MILPQNGISRQTYSSLETGKREVSWTTIVYFQNNENINRMINEMNGLSESIGTIMELPIGEEK